LVLRGTYLTLVEAASTVVYCPMNRQLASLQGIRNLKIKMNIEHDMLNLLSPTASSTAASPASSTATASSAPPSSSTAAAAAMRAPAPSTTTTSSTFALAFLFSSLHFPRLLLLLLVPLLEDLLGAFDLEARPFLVLGHRVPRLFESRMIGR
jgi:hypothetical protein